MAHLIKDKKKLVARVKRIQGQLGSVEKALDEVHDCAQILQTIAACRGALDSLMSEIFEGHIRMHIIDPERHPDQRTVQGGPGADRRRQGVPAIDVGSVTHGSKPSLVRYPMGV